MNVSLTPQLEEMVRSKVATGRYNNASEVVREALRLLDEHDRLKELRAALAIAEGQVARGEVVEYTPDFMENVRERARQQAAQGRPVKPDVLP